MANQGSDKPTRDLLKNWLPKHYAKPAFKDLKGKYKVGYIRLVRQQKKNNQDIMLSLVRIARRNREKTRRLLELSTN
jgi:hypothetical protein